MKKIITVIMIMCLLVFAVGCGGSPSTEETTSESTDFSSVETTWELGSGYYTAGIDIPAGTFDATATAGIGYITSENDSANLCSPEYAEDDDFDDYSPSFSNYVMYEGDRLEVKGVEVELVYSEITSNVSPRSYDESKGVELSSGNYAVGEDLEPGCYCVKYVSGEGGYVSSDIGELNENMDGDSETGDYFDYVSNVILEEGETIEVTSGLTVLFIPEN